MPRPKSASNNIKRLATQQSVNSAIKSICDIMRRSNCAGALQYVPELTWILFLRILDERETREAGEAEAVGAEFTSSLEAPYRWQDWAAPQGRQPERQEQRGHSHSRRVARSDRSQRARGRRRARCIAAEYALGKLT